MRFASFIRQVPRTPVLPSPTLTSADVARALTQMLENQAAIMNDLAQIKNALPWLAVAPFEAAMDISPSPQANLALVCTFGAINVAIARALID